MKRKEKVKETPKTIILVSAVVYTWFIFDFFYYNKFRDMKFLIILWKFSQYYS